MAHESNTLVSVIVPAYNAEVTIGETLLSVRLQSHKNLEIIIVDDGSSDGTGRVASEHAEIDDRVRVVSQANGGVAAARNKGIEVARGEFIAPIDADDLWRPSKIARQLRALQAGGKETAVAYSWSAIIDAKSRITRFGDSPFHVGDVLAQLCYGNFVGNGSSALVRRQSVIDAGGYDPSLRARGGQGCEDWKLFFHIAERYHFALVPDYLTGYRYVAEAMSGDVSQMLRSDALVRSEILAHYPEYRLQVNDGRQAYMQWLLRRELQEDNWAKCSILLHQTWAECSIRPGAAMQMFVFAARLARWMAIGRRRASSRGLPFLPDLSDVVLSS